jgi:POT family proton-dependent oligopeptide transporter
LKIGFKLYNENFQIKNINLLLISKVLICYLISNFLSFFYSLSALEFGWMFSYYGMKAILLLYMVYAVTQGGLGIEESTASSIYAIYGSLIFMLGIIGSYIADRILGPYQSNLYGSIIVLLGHATLGIMHGITGLFLGLSLILIGSFISPLIVGWLGLGYNFHWGFTAAAIGMFIGLLIFILTDKRHFDERSFYPLDKIQKHELENLIKNVIFILVIIFVGLLLMKLFNLFNINNVILVASIFMGIILPIYLFYSILSSKK